MTRNPHRVPLKVWRKWNDDARAVFNGVYEDILNIGADCFVHPKTVARALSADEFSTIAWNAAWIAADQTMSPGVMTDHVETIAA